MQLDLCRVPPTFAMYLLFFSFSLLHTLYRDFSRVRGRIDTVVDLHKDGGVFPARRSSKRWPCRWDDRNPCYEVDPRSRLLLSHTEFRRNGKAKKKIRPAAPSSDRS